MDNTENKFDVFRSRLFFMIMKDDQAGIAKLCQEYVYMPALFMEKVINEIRPENTANDALYLIGKKLLEASDIISHCLPMLENMKKYVSNPDAGKEVLLRFMHIEMEPSEFLKHLELSLKTFTFMGLDELVDKNPNSSKRFVIELLAQQKVDADSRLAQLLNEIAIHYQNFHHDTSLIALVKKTIGDIKSVKQINSYTIIQSTDFLTELEELVSEANRLLCKVEIDSAIKLYEKFASESEVVLSKVCIQGKLDFPDAFLFYGVLLSLQGQTADGQSMFVRCEKMRQHYGELLFLSVDSFQQHSYLILNTLRDLFQESIVKIQFDDFFARLSGHRYQKLNEQYDDFCVLAGDREMEEAFRLGTDLLMQYEKKRNLFVQFSVCELKVSRFYSSYLAINGKEQEAKHEYIRATKGLNAEIATEEIERKFMGLLHNPEQTIKHYFGD